MPSAKPLLLVMTLLHAAAAWGQRGDEVSSTEEIQRAPAFLIPPSPALTPEEALRSFQVAPGFRIELVASEPLVADPVAIAFDPDGRIWAVEMRGWMNDVDGAGNNQPIGRIVTLDDTNGDGRMDRSTVFMDGLVMPRAIQLARDGVLVAAPPHLWFCRDTDGDGRADEKNEVASDYMNFANPQTNPEADPNALLWNIDNWLYSAGYGARFRYRDGQWERQPAAVAGQWGLSQDDYGRHFFNTNQDQLRANPLPSHYASRNPHLYRPAGWNAPVATDQTVWPIRVTPGANRGYRAGVLRTDGRLRVFEAACGPAIYRGGLFPDEFSGDAFVADPVGHLVKRNIVSERRGILSSEQAYASREFLASTDERFRPVNVYTGPDGALYIVDMYRGIIEYVHVMTTYLRRQILDRGLDKPFGLGRIYRIVPAESRPLEIPKMSGLSTAQLAEHLSHANGWRRETAQRLLVEHADCNIGPELEKLARLAPKTVARLHALWTLEGMNRLEEHTILAALTDSSDKARSAAVRLSEPWLRRTLESPVSRAVLATMNDPITAVSLQLALSLGEARSADADAILARLVLQGGGHSAAKPHPYMASAAVSGLRGRELELLERVLALPEMKSHSESAEEFLVVLSAAIFREGDLARIERLFARFSDRNHEPAWVRLALIRGVDGVAHKQMVSQPEAIADWKLIADPEVCAAAARLAGAINWPGKSPAAAPLTAVQRKLFETGRREYLVCATCHLPTGRGLNGLAPALVDSRRTLGAPEILVRIILHGKDEYTDDPPMPSFAYLDDDRIAAILTYVRREWNHAATPVDAGLVARVRRETRNHDGPWTKEELERLAMPDSPALAKARLN